MSFADWEARRKEQQALELALIEWEHEQAVAQAELVRAEKRLKQMKRNRPAMFRPDAPVVFLIHVTMNARPLAGGELQEVTVGVPTMSEVEAELQARTQLKALGFCWRGVVRIVREN